MKIVANRLVSEVVDDIVIGAVGLGFDSSPVKSGTVLPTARHSATFRRN